MGPSCTGASSVTFARPVRARQDPTHPADWSLQGHAKGQPLSGSDQVGEVLSNRYQLMKSMRWIITAGIQPPRQPNPQGRGEATGAPKM